MDIKREVQIDQLLKKGKALLIYGARQVGKTTLVKNFLLKNKSKFRQHTGEDIQLQILFKDLSIADLDEFVENLEILIIDEAQILENLGRGIKLILDRNPKLAVILTGSSSFELANQLSEPLTGRKKTQSLLPLSIKELSLHYGKYEIKHKLEELLLYGSYPEVITTENKHEKRELILEIANSYLFKDILSFLNLKKADVLYKLTKLLAYQISSEVNVNELASNLQVDNKTITHYLDILEKSFVIKMIPAFNSNQRNEIKKSKKIYFLDLGIRNALINQFQDIELRNDKGALWENFVFLELYKRIEYDRSFKTIYFWRTHEQQEIDFILEADGLLELYEAKFNAKKSAKIPPQWLKHYPEFQELKLIHTGNFMDYFTKLNT